MSNGTLVCVRIQVCVRLVCHGDIKGCEDPERCEPHQQGSLLGLADLDFLLLAREGWIVAVSHCLAIIDIS
jgi:hypothetical protein